MSYLSPRGVDFARVAIAKALGRMPGEAQQIALTRWGARSNAAIITKAAVSGGGTGSGEWGAELTAAGQASAEFLELVRPMTIIGRMQGFRRVPHNTPFVAQSLGAVAYWRGQSKAAPVSRGAFDRATMDTLGVSALMVFSNELLEDESPEAEQMILNDLAAAVQWLSDYTFITPGIAAVPGVSPASVTNGATSIASTGDVADDIEAAVDAFGGNLRTASWVLHPRLAVQMGLRAGGRGVAADLGALGGTLAGLPAITSEACPYDSDNGTISLIDAAGICLLEDGVEVKQTDEATVEMADNPTGAGDTPTAATSVVALWQSECTAMKATLRVNYRAARAGSVVVVTGASYPAP